jgi:hypothetical protein
LDINTMYRINLGIESFDFISVAAALHTYIVCAPLHRFMGKHTSFGSVPEEGYGW